MTRSIKAVAVLLLAFAATPAFAQKIKIENQGQAAVDASARQMTAEAVEKDIGKAPSGKAQVVFFRSSSSPGDAVAVRDAAGGMSMIDLDPGMYFVSTAAPGTHAYATADTGPFSMDLDAGRTYYVQAIRTKKGTTQLIRSSSEKFARAANRTTTSP
ncbi:hypothetical protein LF41_1637 [Lysobacter dokdonensis DS-58]|uniref:Carboxypeptidase regulatory-like domain-containing protein n=1 Tax=Lysobacter dokdonensis DS-58 TaxID=1300345 RepID=A0A0A2WHU8_9GAMM|nr:hypothetical protein [Lysobacter dokdonensis]KGQ18282.1 hypothetical protein LF41_1637 [Lysobacter dokdonensis DS-58]